MYFANGTMVGTCTYQVNLVVEFIENFSIITVRTVLVFAPLEVFYEPC